MKLFCKHRYKWSKAIYGDLIIHLGYKRTKWECIHCKHIYFTSVLIPIDGNILYSKDGLKRLDKRE